MVGIVAIIVKIMPEGPDADLEAIKGKAKEVLEKDGALNISFTIEEVAFGLKALMVKFAWPEEKDGDVYEKALEKIDAVSTVDTVDYRRAFG